MTVLNNNQCIHIENAVENNLKHVSLDLPKKQFIVLTGLSGSGKSTLAFDTIYADARRRYLDTLSLYARQFVGELKKPHVERITGLTPAIAVTQGTISNNPRSTVGTMTEIYDYMRLLWGRGGVQICPNCHIEVAANTPDQMLSRLMAMPDGSKLVLCAPIVRQRKGTFEQEIKKYRAAGFTRIVVDGKTVELAELAPLAKTVRHDIDLVIDRLVVRETARRRIKESLELALKYGGGECCVERLLDGGKSQKIFLSQNATCPRCHTSFPEINPNMLAFNSSQGWCEHCRGTGEIAVVRLYAMIGDPSLKLWSGDPETSSFLPFAELDSDDLADALKVLKNVAKTCDVSLTKPAKTYDDELLFTLCTAFINDVFEHESLTPEALETLSQVCVTREVCPECQGSRLKLEARYVEFAGKLLEEVHAMTVDEALGFFKTCQPDERAARIARDVMTPLVSRLDFVQRVGLGYLSLNRGASSLSGGEAQRIRLAGLLGNGLTAVTYILDEPSIGLHARDQQRLIGVLQALRDRGNTVIVVEHDDQTMKAADYLVDIGPRSGVHGGEIVYAGPTKNLEKVKNSTTIDYLLGRRSVKIPDTRRPGCGQALVLKGARKHNVNNVDITVPLGCIVCITGVSGSGKSTLINDILLPAVKLQLSRKKNLITPEFDSLEGVEFIGRLLEVDQKPIGRIPRSNPATYTKVFDEIRKLYAAQTDARMFGYTPSRFSFNLSASRGGGRCETCAGAGVRTIEMKFLANTYVDCETCHGKRFNDATLRVRLNGKSIADVLDMSFDEALLFFKDYVKISKILQTVCDVGLGYLKLGQASPTISGGEAQRIKLAKEIAKKNSTPTLFVFDEPSTGLHVEDVDRLIGVMERLIEKGHSVLIIEHNMDIIKSSDYLIDVGPEAGMSGGKIVCAGTPEQVAACEASHTGRFLRQCGVKPDCKK